MATKNKHKNSYLSFSLGKESFAIPIGKVLEVLQKMYITQIPEMPEFIKGVINFRGDILPVFDLRSRFNLRHFDAEKFVVIVLEIENEEKKNRLCAIVDKVNDVIAIDNQTILPVPEMGLKYKTDYLAGMINLKEHFITILDIDKVFDEQLEASQLIVDS
jgi:purine-binding chemotaxis protein CheW